MQGQELRTWRQNHDWTLEEVASLLGTTKVSVSRWENGVHDIPQTVEILHLLLTEKINIRKVQKYLRK